jgi:NAD(P)H-dependent flavin oxidoreductase YrpB (nitropropane dioxygenase family)
MSTRFTDLVGCVLPLQLAGMGGIGTDVALPAAVSRAGGLGMLGGAGVPPSHLSGLLDQLAAAGPCGVNFLMPFVDRQAVEVAAHRSRVVEFFYGEPDRSLVELAHSGGALCSWQVGSRAEAQAAVECGCDLVVVQGIEAGGHVRGKQPLAQVLAETVAAVTVTVPVLAAGGIGTAGDVRAAMAAGASGVRVGTRFLAAHESLAHPQYVEALIAAGSADTVLTEAFDYGWPDAPHRVLRAAVAALADTDDEFVATADGSPQGVHRADTSPPTSSHRGNIAAMAMYAGTSVAAIRRRTSAADIVSELAAGF